MDCFYVVAAEGPGAGRGVRGHALAWFLQTYLGRRRVRLLGAAAARKLRDPHATVFVGLPTPLTPAEVAGIECRRLVPFDYFDQQLPRWTDELARVFRERSPIYLKPWREANWDFGIPMGVLPIRRYGRFTLAVTLDALLRTCGRRPAAHSHDVAILGRPNATEFYLGGGQTEFVDQRTAWVADVKRHAPQLAFWGGLVEVDPQRRATLEQQFGMLDDLMYRDRKADFATYYRGIQGSRVLLAPGGNVPWSYRHYECLYANGIVVSVDYRQRDMLIPLPKEGMVHVADGASVLPAIDEALRMLRDRPSLPNENRCFVEQYLWNSSYSHRRPKLLERFLQQLE